MRHRGFDEALADAAVADRVIKRWVDGVVEFREMTAEETPAVLRHLVRLTDAAQEMTRHIIETGSASMALGDRDTA
jgi:hypothetical protein